MEAEQILELMNFCWFERRIFGKEKQEFPSLAAQKMDECEEKSSSSTVQNIRIRSYSDRCIAVDFHADSPRSVIAKPKLQKILSQKELDVELCLEGRQRREKPRTKRRLERVTSRSLSVLEFEELKGFKDLGFVFDEEANPSIASIVPALQRSKKMAGQEGGICRPYLSEAWGDHGYYLSRRSRDKDILVNLRIPYVKNEMDMKHHIKNWAHVVASSVR